MRTEPELRLHAAPFLTKGVTTPRVMFDVSLALLPATLAAAWFFGLAALLVIAASILGGVLVEWVFNKAGFNLKDGTLLLTGLLLGLTLPPTLPLWMAFLGGAAAIGLGRVLFGGLGGNLFNPALVGRAFLQAAFPTAITTWRPPGSGASFFDLPHSTFAAPLMQAGPAPAGVDVVSAATPLAAMKFDQVTTELGPLFLGNTGGSIGETAGVLILLGGLYLLLRRAFDWRIPASILLTVAVFATVLHLIDPSRYAGAGFMIGSGGLLLGAVFMATDPVTSPMTPKGAWLFGIGVGVLVVVIRVWGGLPEGVMYAILLMNAAVPLIDRYVRPTPFGRGGKR
jgi:Na+-translocating ferredoxin:NAD+ oxidoreductase subunit D